LKMSQKKCHRGLGRPAGFVFFFPAASAVLTVLIAVLAACSPAPKKESSNPQDIAYGRFTDFRSTVPEFKELYKLIRATLSHNRVTFQGKTGPVSGFAAGTAYPQIWLRDSNTTIAASRYFYESAFLRSWLIEHLALQKDDGGLEDWIYSNGRFDKNTTASDQEINAVQAAARITEILGPGWLDDKINGQTILSRLEKSMLFVLANRFDAKLGLIKGAHTADWGDVDMTHHDQSAIYVDAETHWTCGIYDQGVFVSAAKSLARMLATRGLEEQARRWEEKAQLIRINSDQWLWQEDKGFYKVHVHLDALHHDFDEDSMFAMGGNAEAIISGLASEEKCRRIIESALARQDSFKMSTISGTLLPPYPKKFFRHPMVDDPYEYQNGGQWDWFGGRFVYGMFEHGFSRQAREKLLEIAKKDIANRGLYEWDSPAGIGQGSSFFSGSAGSLAKALFEGYLGLKISIDSLALEPKLGRDSATVHAYIRASDLFIAYEYVFDGTDNSLVLRYNSNIPGRGKIRILLPPAEAGQVAPWKIQGLRVRRDGATIPFASSILGEDRFIIIETDFKNHTLEIGR